MTTTLTTVTNEVLIPEQTSMAWLYSQSTLIKTAILPTKLISQEIIDFPEKIYNVVMSGNGLMYISGGAYLYKMTLGNYPENKEYYFAEDAKKFNPNQDIIVACGKDDILSVETYLGNAIIRNKFTLEQITIFENIDAPTYAVWSTYHNAYLVMGKSGLWKTSNTISLVFSVDNFSLKYLAINDNGQLAMVLSSENNKDVIKILDNDFYKNIFSADFDYNTIHGIVWAGNVFYAIQEFPLIEDKYTANTILINPNTKSSEVIAIQTTIQAPISADPITTTKKIEVLFPKNGITFAIGKEYNIKWLSSESDASNVSIELMQGDNSVLMVIDKTQNNGIYKWKIPSHLELLNRYALKITWLSSSQDINNSGLSGTFAISDAELPQETVNSSDYISGISYDSFTNRVILSFYSGFVGAFDLTLRTFYGLFKSGLTAINGNVANNDQIKQFSTTSKIRVFVGSEQYLSDMWDSGIIETDLSSVMYGGGNNLIPGKKYFVHVQVYSEEYGWSGVQINDFVMPL